MKKSITSILLLMFAAPLWAADSLYVQSISAKILAKPAFSAPVVTTLNKGEVLQILEAQQRWYKVQIGEQTGWVAKFLLSDRPPLDKVNILGDGSTGLDKHARRRASAFTTEGAARGLASDGARKRASDQGLNYRALAEMDKPLLNQGEIERFKGGIKP